MKYMGSKNRHAKELLPIILNNRYEGQCYVEPFVGGANMIDKVDGWRIGCDINEYLIALLSALASGWTPPTELSEPLYADIKLNKGKYPPELVGFAGFPCSYAAKWFGGYCRGTTSGGVARDYILEAWRNVEKQKPRLRGIEFKYSSYEDLSLPVRSLIYCDPPYQATTKYRDSFDHDKFWSWCRGVVSQGHDVFISEYSAPDDFICVWEKQVNNSLTKDTGSRKGVERLFQYNG